MNIRISHFEILHKLGEGGMGVVYKANDNKNNRIVALKVLNRESALDADFQRRFLREAGVGASLIHPNIVQMYETGEYENHTFISLEFIDGKNLREILTGETLSLEKVVDIGLVVCKALGYAHNQNIIHRDIKAENIMITTAGTIKVMDFGLAKIQNASMLTKDGDVLGTVAYMSPEQAIGETVDHRTDIFSLGIVLYELLAGKLPFRAEYETAIVYSILNIDPISIREINKEIPEVLDKIVFKALQKDRQKRYQTMEDLANDLTRVKAFYNGEREILPSIFELTVGSDIVPDDVKDSQIKYAARDVFQSTLVGRKYEFELLRTLFCKVIEGNSQIVFIGGEAGIGKTRLVDELEAYGRTLRAKTLRAQCTFGQKYYPYLPFIEIIRKYLDNKGVINVDTLKLFITEFAPELIHRFPVIRLFLNIVSEKENELGSKEQLWDTICTLIIKISQDRPLILFIDDLHWSDEETLSLLSYIARNTVHSHVMIICTYRSEEIRKSESGTTHPMVELERGISSEYHFTSIKLERLQTSSIKEMVNSIFPESDFGTSFYELLYNETEGNPLFIVETLKLLKTENIIEKKGNTFQLKENYDLLAIPKSIHDIVMRRIGRLKEDEREILEIGAVEGESFHSGTIGTCLELPRVKLLKKLQSLEREHHIIHPEDKMYRFDHGKIREFLYDAITPELRVEYHIMIGSYLSENYSEEENLTPNIAYHFLKGEDEHRALPFLITAGEWSKKLFANKQAIEYYQKVLDISDNPKLNESVAISSEERIRVLEGFGDVLALIGNHESALERFKELITIEEIPPLKKVEILRKIGMVYNEEGEHEKALNTLNHADEELEKLRIQQKGNIDTNIAIGKTRITRSRVYKSLGLYNEAKKEVEGGLSLMVENQNPIELSNAYNNLGVIYEDLGAFEQATEMYSRSLKLCEQTGDKKGIAVAFNNLANIHYFQGDYGKTVENSKKSLEIMTAIGYRSGIAGACNNLGTVYQDQGRYDEALKMHEKCLLIRTEIGDIPGVSMSYGNLGSVKLDLQDYIGAQKDLEKSIQISDSINLRIFVSVAYAWLALTLQYLNESENAKQKGKIALQIAQEMAQLNQVAIAKRCLGIINLIQLQNQNQSELKIDSWIESENYFKECLEIFENLKMEHEIGRTCLELAKYYNYLKTSNEAKKFLERAIEIFQKLGAFGDLTSAENIQII